MRQVKEAKGEHRMAKRSEIEIGQEWAANHKADPMFVDYRYFTYKVRIESTKKVETRRYWSAKLPKYYECKGGREVLVRRVNNDGTLGDVQAIQMSALRMLWADWEVAKAEQDVRIEQQKAESKARLEYIENVEKPMLQKCNALLSRKLDIVRFSCPFAYEEALRLIPVLEALPDFEANEPELKLVQSA